MANKENPGRGTEFENRVGDYFREKLSGFELEQNKKTGKIKLKANNIEGAHIFDIISKKYKLLIECKRHSWTSGNHSPSAKLSIWNEAMYYFYLANRINDEYTNILCVECSTNLEGRSLADLYVKNKEHYIPDRTYIIEFGAKGEKPVVKYPKEEKIENLIKRIKKGL